MQVTLTRMSIRLEVDLQAMTLDVCIPLQVTLMSKGVIFEDSTQRMLQDYTSHVDESDVSN